MHIHPRYINFEYFSNTVFFQCGNKMYNFVTLKNKRPSYTCGNDISQFRNGKMNWFKEGKYPELLYGLIFLVFVTS